MKNKLTLFLLLLVLESAQLFSQDIHFSNYYFYTPELNPALTGNFVGSYRATLIHRGQWNTVLARSAYNTIGAAIDAPFLGNKLKNGSELAIGGHVYSDFAGEAQITTVNGGLGLAYHQGLDRKGNHRISLGAQVLFGQNRLRLSGLRFLDQFDPSTFTGRETTSEVLLTRTQFNVDFNAGLYWISQFDKKINIQAGFAVYHLAEPKFTFIDGSRSFVLPHRFMSNIRLGIEVKKWVIIPDAVLFVQSTFIEPTFGLVASLKLGKAYRRVYDKKINFGLRYRWNDAVIALLQLQYKGLRIGTAIDFNVSRLVRSSRGFGGYELSLVYIGQNGKNKNKNRRQLSCVNF